MSNESTYEKQLYIADVIGNWLDDHNAFFLAKEGEVVWWESITGEDIDFDWQRMSAVELSRVIKVTSVSYEYMTHCTGEAVVAAAQERGRAYLWGVRSTKPVLPNYFNYLDYEVICDSHHVVTLKLLTWFKDNLINPEWMMFKEILRELWAAKGLDDMSDIEANKLIKVVAAELRLTVYHGNKRRKQASVKYACIFNNMTRISQPISVVIDRSIVDLIKKTLC